MWFERRLNSITFTDVESLVRDRVRENRSLDYKDEQPAAVPTSNDKKSEFAADVSALANGVGGLLVYGVAEERENGQPTGVPESINGLRGFVLDAQETRFRTFLETALDPRLPTGLIEFHAIPGGTDGPVLLVRVNRSFSGPHMVRADGRSRNGFYVRDGARNRNLDARGVREAMLASGDWARRFRAFRGRRVAAVLAHEAPVALTTGGRTILHVAPAALDENEILLDPRDCQRVASEQRLLPMRASSQEYCADHFNIDGLVISALQIQDRFTGYLHMFRTGALETVDTTLIEVDGKEVGTRQIEQRLLERVPTYFAYMQALRVPPPYVVGLTITGVRGRQHIEQRDIDRVLKRIPKFDRDTVVVPELVVDAEQMRVGIAMVMEPIFHAMWQAGGHSGCPRYRGGTYDPKFSLE